MSVQRNFFLLIQFCHCAPKETIHIISLEPISKKQAPKSIH